MFAVRNNVLTLKQKATFAAYLNVVMAQQYSLSLLKTADLALFILNI